MQKRECVSCGAPIELGSLKCSYCGMTYEPDYWAGTVRYIPIRKQSRCLRAKVTIDDFILDHADKEALARQTRHDLVGKLAEGLAELAAIRSHYDPMRMVTIVEGEVWVEEPDRHTAFGGLL